MNVIYLGFSVISYPFVKYKYQNKIANELFSFEGGERRKKKKLIVKKKNLKSKLKDILKDEEAKKKTTICEANIKSSMAKPGWLKLWKEKREDKKKKHFLELSNKKLNFGLWSKFKSLFYQNKEKKTQLNQMKKANQLIHKKLNITFILKKIGEIDKLKMLIFSNDQRKLFDFMPKPIILKK